MRTEYKEGELLTKEDIGLVFKSKDGEEWRIYGFTVFSSKDDYSHEFSIKNKENNIREVNRNGKNNFYDHFYLDSFVGSDFTEEEDKYEI